MIMKFNLHSNKSKSGFTIVELLIVIIVISILASITVVAYNGVRNRATDSNRATVASNVQKAIENFATLNDRYPRHSEISNLATTPLEGLTSEQTRTGGPGTEIEVNFDAGSSTNRLTYLATTGPNYTGTGCDGTSICRYYRITYWSYGKNTAIVLDNSR